jgi:hypothetical protein
LTFQERIQRALRTPGKYVDRLEVNGKPEPLIDWQARAVGVVVERHETATTSQRRIGLLWPTEKAYAWLDLFEPAAAGEPT